jgi:adenosine deaminase CECR1
MPKGGLLHAHLDGCVDKAVLLKYAYEYPEMHVAVDCGLTAQSLADARPAFRPFEVSPHGSGNACLSAASGYREGSWIPLAAAREAFDPALGGPEGFDKWLVDSQVINPSEAYTTHNSVKRVGRVPFSQDFSAHAWKPSDMGKVHIYVPRNGRSIPLPPHLSQIHPSVLARIH